MGKYIKTHYSIESAKEDNYLSPSVLTIELENNIRKILFKNTNIKDDKLIFVGNNIDNAKLVPFKERYLHFTALEDNAVISMTQNGTDTSAYDLQTSRDGIEWTQYTLGDEITLSEGETVYWRGNNSYLGKSSSSVYKKFNISNGKVSASGNIMSLLNSTEFETLTTIPSNYCFSKLFFNCTSLTSAPELPATTLAEGCYYNMFAGCTSLIKAPELPATTLADWCYEYIFSGCTSLTEAPELPATTLANYCYQYMFQGCTSLTKAPELPATTLANRCYSFMFNGCNKLNYIKVSFTSWTGVSNPTDYWLSGVSNDGTFVKPSDLPEQRGSSYIPSGWIVENAA